MEKKITRTIERTYATILGYDKAANGLTEKAAILFGKFEEKDLFFAVSTHDFIPCTVKSLSYDTKKYAMPISDFIAHAVKVKEDTKLSRTEKWIIRTINKTLVTVNVFKASVNNAADCDYRKTKITLDGKYTISDAKEICYNLNKESQDTNCLFYGVEKCEILESKYAVNYVDFVAFGMPCDDDELEVDEI